jgi:L-lactate utilization protein LutB
MENPIDRYWRTRCSSIKRVFEENNFEVFLAENSEEAKKIVLEKIIPGLKIGSISWGGSTTFMSSGLYEILKNDSTANVIDTLDGSISPEEKMERRRQALFADLFITGSNAVTETGKLVNLDMIGNRAAAITFGPKHVIVLAGRNKVVSDFDEALLRVKNYSAPINVMRLGRKTPCAETSFCEECKSPDRICNVWTITEKSFPKGRIKLILINEDLGF